MIPARRSMNLAHTLQPATGWGWGEGHEPQPVRKLRSLLDDGRDDLLQALELVGFLQHSGEAVLAMVLHHRMIDMPAAGDDLRLRIDLAQGGRGVLPANAVGDDEIHHDHIKRFALVLRLGEGRDGLRAVRRGVNLIAEVGQHAADDIEDHLLVVHEQDAARMIRGRARGRDGDRVCRHGNEKAHGRPHAHG